MSSRSPRTSQPATHATAAARPPPDEAARLRELARIAGMRPAGGPAYKRAVQDFAARNLGLAYSLAERWRSSSIPQEDVQHAAIVGLLEAIRDWDPRRVSDADRPFAAYAYSKMRYHLQRQKEGPLVPISRPLRDLKRKAEQAIACARCEQREPQPEEIAAGLGVSMARLRDALEARSVSAPADEDALEAPEVDEDEDPVRQAIAAWIALEPGRRERAACLAGAPIRNGDTPAAWGRRVASWLRRRPERCGLLLMACRAAPPPPPPPPPPHEAEIFEVMHPTRW